MSSYLHACSHKLVPGGRLVVETSGIGFVLHTPLSPSPVGMWCPAPPSSSSAAIPPPVHGVLWALAHPPCSSKVWLAERLDCFARREPKGNAKHFQLRLLHMFGNRRSSSPGVVQLQPQPSVLDRGLVVRGVPGSWGWMYPVYLDPGEGAVQGAEVTCGG